MEYHKIARAVNRRINILYEYTDGTTKQDDIEDPLPFDLNAPVVKIEDEDYALFYRDITEEPDKYKGKTVEFKGQVAKLPSGKKGHVCPRSVRHDLLRSGYHVHGHSVPLCRCGWSQAEIMGHGQSRGRGALPQSLPRRGTDSERHLHLPRRTCAAAGGNLLIL